MCTEPDQGSANTRSHHGHQPLRAVSSPPPPPSSRLGYKSGPDLVLPLPGELGTQAPRSPAPDLVPSCSLRIEALNQGPYGGVGVQWVFSDTAPGPAGARKQIHTSTPAALPQEGIKT